MAEIVFQRTCNFKIFPGDDAPAPPFHRIVSAKNLDPPQLPMEYTEIVPTYN